MMPITRNKAGQKQAGVALLLSMLLLFVAVSTVLINAANSRAPALRQQNAISEEMLAAKEALLAYAMLYADHYDDADGNDDNEGPGRLPCPDTSNNGLPNDCSTTLGRLPERVMLPSATAPTPFPLVNSFSGLDRQYWYAVDPNFHSGSDTVNGSTTTSLSLDGQGDIVAVIIAPGAALATQDRSGGATDPASYLECGNQNGSPFSNSAGSNPENCNDQVLAISRDELMELLGVKVAQGIQQGLEAYRQDAYPDTDPDDSQPSRVYYGYYFGSCWTYTTYSYPLDSTVTDPSNGCSPRHSAAQRFNIAMQAYAPDWFNHDAWNTVTQYQYEAAGRATIELGLGSCTEEYIIDVSTGIEHSNITC